MTNSPEIDIRHLVLSRRQGEGITIEDMHIEVSSVGYDEKHMPPRYKEATIVVSGAGDGINGTYRMKSNEPPVPLGQDMSIGLISRYFIQARATFRLNAPLEVSIKRDELLEQRVQYK